MNLVTLGLQAPNHPHQSFRRVLAVPPISKIQSAFLCGRFEIVHQTPILTYETRRRTRIDQSDRHQNNKRLQQELVQFPFAGQMECITQSFSRIKHVTILGRGDQSSPGTSKDLGRQSLSVRVRPLDSLSQ